MSVLKVDLVFRARGYGWQESYYRNFSSAQITAAVVVADTLSIKGAAMLGSDAGIVAYRITDPLTPGSQGQAFYVQGSGYFGNATEGCTDPNTSINVGFLAESINKSKRMFLRGVWDSFIVEFGVFDAVNAGPWLTTYVAWKSYLLQQSFGWLAGTPRVKASITNYTQVNPLIPVFTLSYNMFTTGEVNTFKVVRIAKLNGKSVLNRQLVVYVTAQNTCQAAAPISAAPFSTVGTMTTYDYAFTAASNILLQRAGRRAPGRPLLVSVGRARAAART